jgi:hypothetical protein
MKTTTTTWRKLQQQNLHAHLRSVITSWISIMARVFYSYTQVVPVCTWIWPKVSAGRFRTRSLFITWPSSSRFGFRVLEYRSCTSQVWHVTQSPAAYLKALANWTRAPAIDLSQIRIYFYVLFFFTFTRRNACALQQKKKFCKQKKT